MSGSSFIPELWSDHMLDAMRYAHPFLDPRLEPRDTWAPTGEQYDEAVAWALLLGVDVFKPGRNREIDTFGDTLRLSRPEATVAVIPLCSPAALIEHIKAYAAGTMDMSRQTQKVGHQMRDRIRIRINSPRRPRGK